MLFDNLFFDEYEITNEDLIRLKSKIRNNKIYYPEYKNFIFKLIPTKNYSLLKEILIYINSYSEKLATDFFNKFYFNLNKNYIIEDKLFENFYKEQFNIKNDITFFNLKFEFFIQDKTDTQKWNLFNLNIPLVKEPEFRFDNSIYIKMIGSDNEEYQNIKDLDFFIEIINENVNNNFYWKFWISKLINNL